MQSRETEEHIVAEFTSGAGNTYEVGYPKAAGYTSENLEAEIASASEKRSGSASAEAATFSPLLWVVDGDSTTSRAAIKTGIVGGYVNTDRGIIYNYQLNFANSSGFGFTFKDLSDDTYFCSTPRNGNHYVNYNSSRPSMVGVQ
ncbi:MAG: hypothetical protein ICV87_04375 [Gemmatimonadetes bacterium]|nr:hypothetical protein [Gemmatimonadota bacterium]